MRFTAWPFIVVCECMKYILHLLFIKHSSEHMADRRARNLFIWLAAEQKLLDLQLAQSGLVYGIGV